MVWLLPKRLFSSGLSTASFRNDDRICCATDVMMLRQLIAAPDPVRSAWVIESLIVLKAFAKSPVISLMAFCCFCSSSELLAMASVSSNCLSITAWETFGSSRFRFCSALR